jgi:uncharacterized protein YndB with AHSA1/START domain
MASSDLQPFDCTLSPSTREVQPTRCATLASVEHPTVRRTIDLDCSPAALWRLVTDDALLSTWLGRDVALDVRPGGAGRLVDDDGCVRHLVVREVTTDERLTFAWWPEGDEDAVSEVVLTVEPAGDDGSRLVVTETASAGSSWDARLVSLWLSVCALALV